jgi:chromosome segregation ATPase
MSVGHIIFKEANIPMSKNEAIAIYKKAEKDIKAKEADFAASREEHEDQHEEEVQELDIKKIDDTDERALQAAKDRFENEVHRLTDNHEMRIQKLEGNISELQATIDQDRSAMEGLKKRVLDSSVPDDGPPL